MHCEVQKEGIIIITWFSEVPIPTCHILVFDVITAQLQKPMVEFHQSFAAMLDHFMDFLAFISIRTGNIDRQLLTAGYNSQTDQTTFIWIGSAKSVADKFQ